MHAALRIFVGLLGGICALIALAHIAFGTRAIPGQAFVNATLDSEDRFYAAIFLGFGVALVWSSKDLAARSGVFSALLATFFMGGVARLVSAMQVGMPDPLFVLLTAAELVLPPALWWCHRRA